MKPIVKDAYIKVEDGRRLFLFLSACIIIISWISNVVSPSTILSPMLGLVGICVLGSSHVSIFITERYTGNNDFLIGACFGILISLLAISISVQNKSESGLSFGVASMFIFPAISSIAAIKKKLKESKVIEHSYGESYHLGILYLGLTINSILFIVLLVGTLLIFPAYGIFRGALNIYIISMIYFTSGFFIIRYLGRKWIEEYIDSRKNNWSGFAFLGASCGIFVALFSSSTLFYTSHRYSSQFSLLEIHVVFLVAITISVITGFLFGYLVAINKYETKHTLEHRGDREHE